MSKPRTYVLLYEDETGEIKYADRVDAKSFEDAELVFADKEEELEDRTLPYFVCEEVRSITKDAYVESDEDMLNGTEEVDDEEDIIA